MDSFWPAAVQQQSILLVQFSSHCGVLGSAQSSCLSTMKLIVICAFLLTLLINEAYSQAKAKWCVTSVGGQGKCANLASQLGGKFSCVLGSDEKDCYNKVVSKEADFGVFDGGMIYHAGKESKLKAIMAEKLSNVAASATAYYAVAVVKSGSGITINTLKGKKSCHTGVQKTSGWLIPVGTLLSKKLMSWKDCNQYATVAAFFSQSCAPGAKDTKYNPSLNGSSSLCALCSGRGDNKCARNSKEPYYSYEGAFKCLKDGAGEVAFIKASVLTKLSVAEQANYELLCLDGTRKSPKDYATCNLARVSSHAVLARPSAPISYYQKLLKEIDGKLSEVSGGPLKYDGTLFSKATIGLEKVASAKQNYDKYLDTAYINDVAAFEHCAYSQAKAKWCVTSVGGQGKCANLASQLGGKFSCVLGSDEKDCYNKVVSKEADFGVFDGGMIYHAGKESKLKAIMAEKLSNVAASATAYYAVAVVKSGSGVTINTLKGKKSCHTGVQKTSGWLIPVGTLLSKKLMSWKDCNQYATVAAFFSQSCAPGAIDTKYNPSLNGSSSLCALCSGIGDNKCARNSKEPYYSYEGAFKCLKDGAGEVAFIKASVLTKLSVAEQANYELLCLDGTRKSPKDYATCNLARVSSHAVLARPGAPISDYQKLLKEIDGKLSEVSGGPLKYDGTLFSKATIALEEVASAKQNYDKYLDTAYINDVAALEHCAKWCVTSTTALSACKDISNALGKSSVSCTKGTSEKDCYMKIANKEADVGMFDGGSVYHAGKDKKLKAIMAEKLTSSGDAETAYYAIAVVNANSGLTIKTLKGEKSCHTGVQKTSGWIVPLGHFLRKKMMHWPSDCSQYGAASSYFSASCAPGANDVKYNAKKTGADKLCSLCAGKGAKKCARNSGEPYYSYEGAFKCLKDGKGKVAFIKQGIIPSADESKYKLLCQDGTLKDPKDYKSCNLARVPSHAMLARPDAPIAEYQKIFTGMFNQLGGKLFTPAGVLFSKNTVSLTNVSTDKQSYTAYLDKSYMMDIAELEGCVKSSASTPEFKLSVFAMLLLVYKIFV